MKKSSPGRRRAGVSEGLRPEHRFDHAGAKPDRFAPRGKQGPLILFLDAEIAQAFQSPEAVIAVLRAIASAMPRARKAPRKPTAKRAAADP